MGSQGKKYRNTNNNYNNYNNNNENERIDLYKSAQQLLQVKTKIFANKPV